MYDLKTRDGKFIMCGLFQECVNTAVAQGLIPEYNVHAIQPGYVGVTCSIIGTF